MPEVPESLENITLCSIRFCTDRLCLIRRHRCMSILMCDTQNPSSLTLECACIFLQNYVTHYCLHRFTCFTSFLIKNNSQCFGFYIGLYIIYKFTTQMERFPSKLSDIIENIFKEHSFLIAYY